MDDSTFETLVRAHAGAISAYARAVCADRWIAEEAVQETFLRAWKYRPSFNGSGSYEGWLIRICRNCIIDLANRPRVGHTDVATGDIAEPADLSPELLLLVGDLSVAHREVLALCGILGYDYESAAELLAVPIGTVRSRLARARAEVRARLDAGEEAGAG